MLCDCELKLPLGEKNSSVNSCIDFKIRFSHNVLNDKNPVSPVIFLNIHLQKGLARITPKHA
jgi:hypothetical protein